MSYKLLGRVERKVHIVRNERSAIGSPEIGILRSMVLYSGCVADDAEAEKRNIVQIASLRNGSRLHINGKTVGETLLDGIQLRTVGDELVAGTNKSAVDAAFHSGFVQRQGMFQQRGTSLVRGGKTLHLSVLVTVAAPDVVIHQTLLATTSVTFRQASMPPATPVLTMQFGEKRRISSEAPTAALTLPMPHCVKITWLPPNVPST